MLDGIPLEMPQRSSIQHAGFLSTALRLLDRRRPGARYAGSTKHAKFDLYCSALASLELQLRILVLVYSIEYTYSFYLLFYKNVFIQ